MSNIDDKRCPCGGPDRAIRRGLCRKCRRAEAQAGTGEIGFTALPSAPPAQPAVPVGAQVVEDRQRIRQAGELAGLRVKYAEALRTIERQEQELQAIDMLGASVEAISIEPRHGSGTSEATAVLVASDWHSEEFVGPEIGGLNRHDLEIGGARATRFFQSGLRLIRLLQQDVKIDTAVLALLGDFITGEIHGAENAENNLLPPTEAIVLAQNRIIGGIEFLLDHSKLDFVLPCHSGNHARTTHTTRFASENGHSLEYLMYLHLAAYFRKEPRLTFQIAPGMHSYLPVYNETIRFQHGHAIKYGGGVGGIYIPANKAIAQWDKARPATLNVFGHFHQSRDGGNFICNGSAVGYNSFALSIKADFELPKQTLFLMDKKRGRTCTWPILLEKP